MPGLFDGDARLEALARAYLARAATTPPPPRLAERATRVAFASRRRRSLAALGGGVALFAVTAAAATAALAFHAGGRPPVSPATATATPSATRAAPTPTPSEAPPTQVPVVSTLTLSGAEAGSATIANSQVDCGSTGTGPPGNRSIEARFSLGGTQYSFTAVQATGGNQLSVSQTSGAMLGWGGPASGSMIAADTGANVDSTLAPDSSGRALHVAGRVTCPAPGSPSHVTLSGALSGALAISHVNCGEPGQAEHAQMIDVIGAASGREFDLSVETSNGGPFMVVFSDTAGREQWLSVQSPAGVTAFGVTTGSTFDVVLSKWDYATAATVPGSDLTVSGTVTCPG